MTMTLMTALLLSCIVLCYCRHKEMVEGAERMKMTETQLVDLKPLPDSNTAATEVQQLQQQYRNSNNKIINI